MFLFVNKMDQEGADKAEILKELQRRLDTACIDFSEAQTSDDFFESIAMCDEALLEKYLDGEKIEQIDKKF